MSRREGVDEGEAPFRVPSMAETADLPSNGRTVASLFSGAGGSSLGYRMAGFEVRFANEFVAAARDTYRANASDGTALDPSDIRDLDADQLLEAAGVDRGELDVLDGSPPCAAFSKAGKIEKGWGASSRYSDTAQRSDDLFWEFARILEGVQPRAFVAENVAGLAKGKAQGYFKQILAALKAAGYRVRARVVDAQWLGVPQARQRLIFVGVREDLGASPVHPKPWPFRYTLRDAIPWIADGRGPTPEPETWMAGYAVGEEWAKLAPGEQSGKYYSLKREDPDAPCRTVLVEGGKPHAASVAHPFECRKFSTAELRRICAFPDDFELAGTYAQQYERLARSVPPLVMKAIAETVRDGVLG